MIVFGILNVAAQDFALNQLENSPRHHEWVKVPAGEREVTCFVAYPEISEKATVVIAIHENCGLTDWVRSFADQLAGEDYIVVAPDLLSGFSGEIETTADFENSDAARNAIYELSAEQVENDLNAVQKYDFVIYPDAGHAYMRQGDDPEGSPGNKKARDESWKRMTKILAEI